MRNFILRHARSFQGLSYKFSVGSTSVRWPQEDGKGLGVTGAWNLLFRAGASPQIIDNELPVPEREDVLYVTADETFSSKTEKALQDWMEAGGKVLASGCPEAWCFVFPDNTFIESARLDNPYAALAWIQDGAKPELIAPPSWTYLRIKTDKVDSIEYEGKMAAISGERQTPERALIDPLENVPAILHVGNFYYFNGNPFAALQSWMQGQEDLVPWLAWRHRIFWLDEFTAFLCKNLRKYRLLPEAVKNIPGLPKTTVVFKHDLDFSRDTTYLDMENQSGLSGVYPILKDSNTKFWVNTLKDFPEHEPAFHYNTGQYSRVLEGLRSKILGLPKKSYSPDRNAIKGNGLLKQVQWAKGKGIATETLHRHLFFIFYPELIDAFDTVYRNEKNVLGGNSFFSGLTLRWGINTVDRMRGTYSDGTDPLFPYWFPFRLAHAGDGGRMLRGWESTSLMEAEPALVEQMLDYNIPGLSQRVIVLNFHPAHARTSTFVKGGCINWFREILDLCKQYNVEVKTLAEVYRLINASLPEVN